MLQLVNVRTELVLDFFNHFVVYWLFIHLANDEYDSDNFSSPMQGYVDTVVGYRWMSNSSTANLIDFNKMSWRKWAAAISGVFKKL